MSKVGTIRATINKIVLACGAKYKINIHEAELIN